MRADEKPRKEFWYCSTYGSTANLRNFLGIGAVAGRMGGGIGLESSGGGSSDGGGGEAELNGRNAARLLKRHCAGSTRQRARAIQTIV